VTGKSGEGGRCDAVGEQAVAQHVGIDIRDALAGEHRDLTPQAGSKQQHREAVKQDPGVSRGPDAGGERFRTG
jgi:hypothetical protein